MKNKIRAVIFDMDGVIVDSEPLQSLSWEKLLTEYGIKPIFNNEGLIHEVGPTGDESYFSIMKKHNLKENIGILRKRRREIFEEIIKEKLKPMSGLLNSIKILKKENLRIAVASNRVSMHVDMMLEKLGIKDFFEIIVGRELDIKPKPSPDIFLRVLEKLKVKPSECLVLEDSETGVISAKRAKMKVIAIPNRYTINHNFSKADRVLGSLSEITIKVIKNL